MGLCRDHAYRQTDTEPGHAAQLRKRRQGRHPDEPLMRAVTELPEVPVFNV